MTQSQPTSERYQMDSLLSALREADGVLLFLHVSPDGDTIGSALGLKLCLEQMRKRVWLALDGTVPETLCFLPDAYCVRSPEAVRGEWEAFTGGKLAVAVDVSCRDRMGAGEALFVRAPRTAQIDHHGTNPAFADINVIDGEAPATAILVFRLAQALKTPICRETATCLYAALSTDTGNFVYKSTDAEAFEMMAELMRAGLDIASYARLLFRRKSREFIAVLTGALPTMRYLGGGEIAGMSLRMQQIEAAHATGEHCDGVVDYAIDASGVQLAYFARETEQGRVKVSLRALAPHRVDTVAARFGGGGHQLAAGCTLDLPLDDAVRAIEEALEQAHRDGI